VPIYEYECTKCGSVLEAWQKFSDRPLTRCRHCSGKLHKLISQSAFHLKGTGWYVTDYANKGKSPSASSSPPGGKAKKQGGKEKKPDTGSDSSKKEE